MKKAPILKVKHKKNNTVILVLSLLIVIAGLGPAIKERDVWFKPEHDNDCFFFLSFPCSFLLLCHCRV